MRTVILAWLTLCCGCVTQPQPAARSAQHSESGVPDNSPAVFVIGAVSRPGRIPHSEGMTLSLALAHAGGFTWARGLRVDRGEETVLDLGPKEIRDDKLLAGFVLQAGDMVAVRRMH